MKKLLFFLLTAATLTACGTRPDPTREHGDFVVLTDVIPDAILEIRYYSTYNFVGARIDGYEEPLALLTREAADSLLVVNNELKALGYRIKIWDTYRPQCAVNHFIRWAENLQDTTMKYVFYPMVDKSLLFEQEYIMARSGHSRGSTVDLTLVDAATGKELDMGSPFDWFGTESHPDYTNLTEEQIANRHILWDAMFAHGFKGIDSEWWHFTLINEPYPDTYFDFPVKRYCSPEETTIAHWMKQYSQMALQDVYKSFYQDRFGPNHMIADSDTAVFRRYLEDELQQMSGDTVTCSELVERTNPYFEPTGTQGRFVRVYLRSITEGLISADLLHSAFLRSSKPTAQPQQSWADEWANIEKAARKAGVACSDEECRMLRQAAQEGRAVHHSEVYRNAYHPHYRIVERTLFENEIQPLINRSKN